MNFEQLTQENKEFFKNVYYDSNIPWNDRMIVLSEYIDKSARTVSKWAVKLGLKRKDEIESLELLKAKSKIFSKSKKTFFITWAQNNTPTHDKFFSNVLKYAEFRKAAVHVIAGRYQNPTSVFSDKKHDVWSSTVIPYLDAARHDVHKYVSIMSDVKIQPTAVNPMTGMQGMSGINSCVFGSPKLQMEMCAVLEGCKPKMMVTTGACTVKNYTDSKTGKKGEFHHTLGFAIIEIKDDETFFIRQVSADENGDFTDVIYNTKFLGKREPIKFNTAYEEFNWKKDNFGADPYELIGYSVVEEIDRIDACVFGDIHYGYEDKEVMRETHNFLKRVNPNHIVLHDVFDGKSINHHESKDPFAQYGKEIKGTNSLKTEIDYLLTELEAFEKYNNVVIVRSNHDDFLDRWLKNEDWKKQSTSKNSLEYMKYSQILLEQYANVERNDEIKGVVPTLIEQKFPDFITLGRSDSYIVNGWELAQHGDIGTSGSRGSLQQFRKLNTKVIVGHYHSPGRMDGALSVGTSTVMRMGYNIGASAWLQSQVIIHTSGKAQHINFIDGEFTTIKY